MGMARLQAGDAHGLGDTLEKRARRSTSWHIVQPLDGITPKTQKPTGGTVGRCASDALQNRRSLMRLPLW